MRTWRMTIAGMMGLVLLSALGLMGFRGGTPVWAGGAFAVSLLFLLAATITLILGCGRRKAFCLGFALFGWAYLVLSMGPLSLHHLDAPPLVSGPLLSELCARLHPAPMVPQGSTWSGGGGPAVWQATGQNNTNPTGAGSPASLPVNNALLYIAQADGSLSIASAGTWPGNPRHFEQTGHALLALLVGWIGGLWALREYGRRGRTQSA